MLYPFMSFPDGTEIVYSDVFHKTNDNTNYVRVEIKRTNNKTNKFDYMEYIVPSGELIKVNGFSLEEIQEHRQHLNEMSDIIIECALDEKIANKE